MPKLVEEFKLHMTVTMGFEIKSASEVDSDITRNKNKFLEQFGSPPDFYIRVPGRVNIIGERKSFLKLHFFILLTWRS